MTDFVVHFNSDTNKCLSAQDIYQSVMCSNYTNTQRTVVSINALLIVTTIVELFSVLRSVFVELYLQLRLRHF